MPYALTFWSTALCCPCNTSGVFLYFSFLLFCLELCLWLLYFCYDSCDRNMSFFFLQLNHIVVFLYSIGRKCCH